MWTTAFVLSWASCSQCLHWQSEHSLMVSLSHLALSANTLLLEKEKEVMKEAEDRRGWICEGRQARKRCWRRSDGEKEGKGRIANSNNRRDRCTEKAKDWKEGPWWREGEWQHKWKCAHKGNKNPKAERKCRRHRESDCNIKWQAFKTTPDCTGTHLNPLQAQTGFPDILNGLKYSTWWT